MRGIYPLPQESVVKQSPTAEDPMADATQNKEGSQVSGVFLPTDPSPYDNNMSNSNGVQQSYELVQQTFHPVQQSDRIDTDYQIVSKSASQVLYDEIDLLLTAGEITEVEAAELHQLAAQGDLRVRDAIAQHSQGNSSLLIHLLHRNDGAMDLLFQRDLQYASSVQESTNTYYSVEVQSQPVYTYSSLYSYDQGPGQPLPYVAPQVYAYNSQVPSYNPQVPAYNPDVSSLTSYSSVSSVSASAMGGSLPSLFYSDGYLCGLILKQTQTKLIFKKWKHCVFMLKPNTLNLYQTIDDWRSDRGVYWHLPIHRYLVRMIEMETNRWWAQ